MGLGGFHIISFRICTCVLAVHSVLERHCVFVVIVFTMVSKPASSKAKAPKVLKFTVKCTGPVNDGIFDISSFVSRSNPIH